jgi:ABC-type uncharacterized transport system permease subunit
VLITAFGRSPITVWATMVGDTLGDRYAVGQVLYRATDLALTGLAVALALDVGLLQHRRRGPDDRRRGGRRRDRRRAAGRDAPAPVAVLLCTLAAASAGGAIAAVTGALRVWRGAHEVITGIMLNAVVAGGALWLGNEVLFAPGGTRSRPIVAAAELPGLGLAGSAASAAVLIAVASAITFHVVRTRTSAGLIWRAVGASPGAAAAMGHAVGRWRLGVMIASGALAGLVATSVVLGHKHAFEEGLGRGTGYLGVAVALLGRRHPLGVLAAALAVAFFSHGGLVVGELVPKELTELLLGALVLAIAVAPTLVGWAAEAAGAARAPGSTPTAASAEGPSA